MRVPSKGASEAAVARLRGGTSEDERPAGACLREAKGRTGACLRGGLVVDGRLCFDAGRGAAGLRLAAGLEAPSVVELWMVWDEPA